MAYTKILLTLSLLFCAKNYTMESTFDASLQDPLLPFHTIIHQLNHALTDPRLADSAPMFLSYNDGTSTTHIYKQDLKKTIASEYLDKFELELIRLKQFLLKQAEEMPYTLPTIATMRDAQGRTPLMLALQLKLPEIIVRLLNYYIPTSEEITLLEQNFCNLNKSHDVNLSSFPEFYLSKRYHPVLDPAEGRLCLFEISQIG